MKIRSIPLKSTHSTVTHRHQENILLSQLYLEIYQLFISIYDTIVVFESDIAKERAKSSSSNHRLIITTESDLPETPVEGNFFIQQNIIETSFGAILSQNAESVRVNTSPHELAKMSIIKHSGREKSI